MKLTKAKAVKAPPPPPPVFSGDDATRIRALELRVVSYQHEHTPHDAAGNSYWLPRDMVGADGKTLVRWQAAGDADNNYAISAWHPWHDGMFGGAYETMGAVLGWIERARDIRAGKETHF